MPWKIDQMPSGVESLPTDFPNAQYIEFSASDDLLISAFLLGTISQLPRWVPLDLVCSHCTNILVSHSPLFWFIVLFSWNRSSNSFQKKFRACEVLSPCKPTFPTSVHHLGSILIWSTPSFSFFRDSFSGSPYCGVMWDSYRVVWGRERAVNVYIFSWF